MIYIDLIREIELYTHMEGAQIREMIKRHINEAILDFLRMKEWEKVKNVVSVALNGSGAYTITGGATPIAADFEGEIELLDSGGIPYSKVGYSLYLQHSDKSGVYSILGDTLYVEGDSGTLTLIYIARGDEYPLTDDDDEVYATLYYWDIIKQMVVVRILKFLGDPQAEPEELVLRDKLLTLRASENRTRNNGKLKVVQR